MGKKSIPGQLQNPSSLSSPSKATAPRPDRSVPGKTLDALLRPDERFLLRVFAGQLTEQYVRSADQSDALETAARLGMLGHLARRGDDLRRCGASEDWLARCSEAARHQAAFNLLLAYTERDVLAKLESHGISATGLKGVSLSRILYGSPAVRSTSDIDLLIRTREISAAAAVLENLGYRSRLPRALLSRRSFLKSTDHHTSESVYVSEAGGIPLQVELHWKILPLPEEALWSALQEYAAAGGAVRGLSPEFYLLYLCSHFAGHGWRSLHWLADIAAFLEKFMDTMEAPKFLELARRAKLQHSIGVTFALVRDYFGLDWPAAGGLDTSVARRTANNFLRRPLEPASNPGVFAVHRERLLTQDSAIQRMRYLLRLAYPTREEWAREDGSLRPTASAWATRAARLLRLAAGAGIPGIIKNDDAQTSLRPAVNPLPSETMPPSPRPREAD